MSAQPGSTAASVLLLDVMGTLVYDPFYVDMPAFFGMSLEQLLAEKHPTAWVEFEHGEIDGQAFLDRFFTDGRAYDQAGLLACMRAAYRWLDGVQELLEALHARGTRMVALSNYSTWYEMIEERLELSRYLSWDLVSCHTGLRKPDPEVYRHAARAVGTTPERCLFVDDREVNCEAARSEGMPAVHFTDARALRAELEQRGWL